MDALMRFATSRRTKQLLPWLSAAVLLAGIGSVLGVYFSNTAQKDPGLSNKPVALPKTASKQIPLPEAARRVAGRFILTAVARRHLKESYNLTHPKLRQGLTLKQWETGNIPVAYFPVGKNLKDANFKVDLSYPNEAQLELVLVPKKTAKERPQQFLMGLRKFHQHWVVDYWNVLGGPGVPDS
ncbi:MAG TPA: hypothetical protein VF895_06595 [Gaiellaceae bacterium]